MKTLLRIHTLMLLLSMTAPCIHAETSEKQPAFRVLVFSKTLLFRHTSIPNGITAIQRLGAEHGFAVEATEDSAAFTPDNLTKFQAVVFLSTTGDVLDEAQENALKEYVLGGGGLAGVHGAIPGPQATEENWDWYKDLYCTQFAGHSAVVPARLLVEDKDHASTCMLPHEWNRTDEWYNFTRNPRSGVHTLLTVDDSSSTGGTMGADHPIAWCRPAGKGRLWFTALGHTEETFAEPLFLQHLLGGIQWAAGHVPGAAK